MKNQNQKPSKLFVAEAVYDRENRGYVAKYAFPGGYLFTATDRGQTMIFDSEEEAEHEAAISLVNALNNRSRDKDKPERYKKLQGNEFAVLLAEAGLTPTFFAFLYGTTQDRVIKWIDSVESVPHPARLLLEIFKAIPATLDIAEKETANCTEARSSRPRGFETNAESLPKNVSGRAVSAS